MAAAQQPDFGQSILTGEPHGTYVEFGRNISDLGKQCGYDLIVRQTHGSIENLQGLRQRQDVQFGIVQSDVLEFMYTYAPEDPGIEKTIAGIVIAAPLYSEEVHILARKDIRSIYDLEDKDVSIGNVDSGTNLTAALMLNKAGVVVADLHPMNAGDSLDALLNGDIDAFFYVAGAPAPLFEDPAIDPEMFHLVPLADADLSEIYQPSVIPAGTYPFQDTDVDVVSVKAILTTFDFDPSKNDYHRQSCTTVSDFTYLMLHQFDDLLEFGHPKWKDVDLTDIPPGWRIGECVVRGLAPDYSSACTEPTYSDTDTRQQPQANRVYRSRVCAIRGC